MRRFVDLHTHSTASDGALPPRELVRLAEAQRLAAVALTDHDTTAGLSEAREAAREFPGLRFIGGIEISARLPGGTLHILGLDIDEANVPLQHLLRQLRQARQERNPKILAALSGLGLEVGMEDVLAVAQKGRSPGRAEDRVVGRLHIAEMLCRKGYVRDIDEAFARYIGEGRPAYVDKERLEPRQAIAGIHQAGGLAILAHPPQLGCRNSAQLQRVLRGLIRHGLDGIEVYHSDHSPQQTRLYLELARRYKLAVVGGSDFHGSTKPEARLGRPRVPLAAIAGRLADQILRQQRAGSAAGR